MSYDVVGASAGAYLSIHSGAQGDPHKPNEGANLMYSNLSMIMAQEHQRDLQREAQAARLARSVAPTTRPAKPIRLASPRFPRISFVWRAPVAKLAVSERPET
jgi:hypothetical protein